MKKLFSLIIVFALLFSPVAQADDTGTLTQVVEQSTLLLQLKQKLAQIQYRYTLLEQNVEGAKESLLEMDAAITNLEMVLANLDDQIKNHAHQITSVKTQKERKTMEIGDLEEDVQILELQVADQKVLVGQLMTMIYVKRDVYYNDEGVDPIKVLASPDSVSQTLQNITYLDLIEGEGQKQIERMTTMTTDLTNKWTELRTRKAELDTLDLQLSDERTRLEGERAAQQELLDETKAEKAVLEAMLATSDERKEDLFQELKIYEANVKSMEERLAGMNALLTEDQQEVVSRIEEDMLADFDAAEASAFLQLDWPVSPDSGLTAFFNDSGYKKQFGVGHGALDIRAKQGSSIFAPADGVVSAVVYDETSTRYAYVQVVHRMGVMTVYGHVSATAVSAGDYVTRGQLLGYTGAMPGSIGAGVRSTGPHLHFEVWQDGVRVDPLRYLPLEEVPMDSLPEEYLNQVQSALEEQIRQIQDAIGL
ncbi:MAG: peptidoglycan DD-metalloendopeptidase family protein [Candidatus Gracilibacteria bacterium]